MFFALPLSLGVIDKIVLRLGYIETSRQRGERRGGGCGSHEAVANTTRRQTAAALTRRTATTIEAGWSDSSTSGLCARRSTSENYGFDGGPRPFTGEVVGAFIRSGRDTPTSSPVCSKLPVSWVTRPDHPAERTRGSGCRCYSPPPAGRPAEIRGRTVVRW